MKSMKIVATVLALCLLCAALVACQPQPLNNPNESTTGTPQSPSNGGGADIGNTPDDSLNAIKLVFDGTKCEIPTGKTDAVTASGNVFTISKAGTYELSGSLSDGQIRVEVPKTAEKTNEVFLIFNGFSAYSSTTAPFYVVSADEVTIELKQGTVSRLEDADTYQIGAATKPSACLFSSDDLVIRGNGSLFVTGHFKNGIGCSNDLRIKNGTVKVQAPNNILKGGDSVTISGGHVTLSGGEDGIKTDNEEIGSGKGFVLISENAKVDISCSDDAIQATQLITIESTVSVTGTAGDSALNCDGAINCADGVVNIVVGGSIQ